MSCPITVSTLYAPGTKRHITATSVFENTVYACVFDQTTMQSTIVKTDRKSGVEVGAITYPGYLGGLSVGGAGVVYACDPNTHRVLKYSSGTWSVFAGSTQGYAEKTTRLAGSAKFSSPGACCIQGTALYVADAGGTLLRAVTLSSGITRLVVGVGQLLRVTSVCADIYPSRLLVTDGHAIRRIDVVAAAGRSTVTTLAGQASTPGYLDAPGPAWTGAPVNTAARFDQPRGIVALNEGYASADTPALNWVVYVADTNNHCIRRVDTFLNVTTLAGSPKTPGANDGSTGGIDDVRFTFPAAMGVDKYGRYAFVADNAVATAAVTAADDTPRLRRLAVNVCKGTCTFDAATNSSVFYGSAAYCGGCSGNDGEACAAPMECRTGACACPKGFVMCGGRCVDTLSDAANCSKCGKKCLGEQVCVKGKCTDPVCKGGLACNHRCVNPQTDAGNCGKCGLACSAGQSCVCGACRARDMSSDPNNCGACGVKCPPGKICSNGQCVCDGGFKDCGGTCTNITSDAANCGFCNIHCAPGMVCQNSRCVRPAAPPPPVSRFRLFRA